MKSALVRAGINSDALMVQLGWQVNQRHEVEPALLKLLTKARQGDAKAVATLALVVDADDPAAHAVLPPQLDPFAYMTREDVMYDLGGPIRDPKKSTVDIVSKILWGLLHSTIKGCVEADQVAMLRHADTVVKYSEAEARKIDKEHIMFVRKAEAKRVEKTPLDILPKYRPQALKN